MWIKELREEDFGKYHKINEKFGTIFTSIEWLKNFSSNIKIFGIYTRNSELIGGFAIHVESKILTRLIKNPPLTHYPLLFVRNEAKKISSFQTYNKQVMRTLSSFLKNTFPKDIVYVSFHYQFIDFQPFIWNGYRVIPRYTYLIDLSKSVENLKKQMSSERKNDINKAIRDELRVKLICDLKEKEVALSLIKDTFTRQGKKINFLPIKQIIFNFLSEKNGFGFVTYNPDGIPLSASICVHDKKSAYYILGGYNSNEKHHGAGALSLWHCILEAKKRNLSFFDFEGSMIPNVEKYFRGFGGKIVPYFTVVRAPYFVECVLKLFRRSMF